MKQIPEENVGFGLFDILIAFLNIRAQFINISIKDSARNQDTMIHTFKYYMT